MAWLHDVFMDVLYCERVRDTQTKTMIRATRYTEETDRGVERIWEMLNPFCYTTVFFTSSTDLKE